MIKNIATVCVKRLRIIDDERLIEMKYERVIISKLNDIDTTIVNNLQKESSDPLFYNDIKKVKEFKIIIIHYITSNSL